MLCTEVLFQIFVFGECVRAYLTLNQMGLLDHFIDPVFLQLMLHSHVTLQIGLLVETYPTDQAGEWPNARVGVGVCAELGRGGEFLVTFRTGEVFSKLTGATSRL